MEVGLTPTGKDVWRVVHATAKQAVELMPA